MGGGGASKAADDAGAPDGADEGTGATRAAWEKGAEPMRAAAVDVGPWGCSAEAVAEPAAEAATPADHVTAVPVMKWNVGEFLPPMIRQYFETSVRVRVRARARARARVRARVRANPKPNPLTRWRHSLSLSLTPPSP